MASDGQLEGYHSTGRPGSLARKTGDCERLVLAELQLDHLSRRNLAAAFFQQGHDDGDELWRNRSRYRTR